jgi:hypothetical protein
MKNEIKELLAHFNYQQSEQVLEKLENFFSITIPKNKYSIKNYSFFVQSKIKEIKIKKSHIIELVSRIMFNENWHVLSKNIKDDFSLNFNSKEIVYGEDILNLSNIEDCNLIYDTILIITNKDDSKLLIISKKCNELKLFLQANTFVNSVCYFVTNENKIKENVKKIDYVTNLDEEPVFRFIKSTFSRVINEDSNRLKIEVVDNNVVYSMQTEGEMVVFLRQPRSTWGAVEATINLFKVDDLLFELTIGNNIIKCKVEQCKAGKFSSYLFIIKGY